MEDNRTKWLIALGALVGLCLMTLLCVLGVGGMAFYNTQRGEVGVESGPNSEQPRESTGGEEGGPTVRKSSNELVVLGADPPTLDPALASDATSAAYIVEIFSGLVTLNTELEVVADIAREWEVSDDGTLYTFFLNEGVRFANGSPLTAEDFKYSIERACDPSTQSPVADTYLGDIVGCRDKLRGESSEVSGIRVVNEQTVEVQIDAAKVYFLAKLTYPTAYVVDQETIEQEGRLWATKNPNGAGAFQLEEYSFGEKLVLIPNENYHGSPKPSVERITYVLSGGSAMTMYETDEIDIVGVGLADLDRVQDPSSPLNRELREFESLSVGYIGLNAALPPFDDLLVRQAFNMAIDKEKLIEVVVRDTVAPAYGILPPGLPGYNAELEGLRYDPDKARELLEQSSYGGPEGLPDITLHVSGAGGGTAAEVEAIIEMWKQELGVEVSIEQTEWATFLFDVSRRPNPYQAFSIGWIGDYPDPENFLDILFHCDSLDNKTGYCNEEVDALLEQARVEQDHDRRMELYQQAEEIIVEEGAWVPLWFNQGYVLIKPWVKDYMLPLTIVPLMKYVKIEH
ncbi:MAG: peptide ABC transporter substrate-binding protein [Ardenticatenales bacterium]|nr:peptide ABC transporter substrate-binding protein [Ardenticatenales bacterium]